MQKRTLGFGAVAFALLMAFASCSSMKQIWDLKGIRVSANDQVYTGKSTTVPMDIKGGNLRFEFNATSDPVDNGYPVSVKVDDSSVVSVTQSASDPTRYTITGLKSGYTAVTASCSSAYTFTFIVYVADSSRGITVDKLKQQRDAELARIEAEAKAKAEAEAAAKKAAEEKAAADKAAAAAAAKVAADKAAAEKAAAEAASKFAPKAGEIYLLDAQETDAPVKKYVHFTSAGEMRMVHTLSGVVEGWVYSIKYMPNDSKSENGIRFKNFGGTIAAFVDDSALTYDGNWAAKVEREGMKSSNRYIYPSGYRFDPETYAENHGKNINSSLYNTWRVDYRDEGMNFPRYYGLKFSSNGSVVKSGPRYMFESIGDDMETAFDSISKTYTYTNKEGLVTLQNGEAYYYDGKRLNDVWLVKKVTDSALIKDIKNAPYYNPEK